MRRVIDVKWWWWWYQKNVLEWKYRRQIRCDEISQQFIEQTYLQILLVRKFWEQFYRKQLAKTMGNSLQYAKICDDNLWRKYNHNPLVLFWIGIKCWNDDLIRHTTYGWYQYSICGKTRGGSAVYFWLIFTIFSGVYTNLEGWEAPEGVKPPNPWQIEHWLILIFIIQ